MGVELDNLSPKVQGLIVQNQKAERELLAETGWLGKFFGSGNNAKIHYLGLLLIVFSITLGVVFVFRGVAEGKEVGTLLIPLITAIIGYLAGKSDKKGSKRSLNS